MTIDPQPPHNPYLVKQCPRQSGTTWLTTGAIALVFLISASEPASFGALSSAAPEQWQQADQEILARWLARIGKAARQLCDDAGALPAALPTPSTGVAAEAQLMSPWLVRESPAVHAQITVRLALLNLPPPAFATSQA